MGIPYVCIYAAYCYSGGFSLNAVFGGAVRATALDSSARALSSLEKNIQLNNLDRDRFELIPGLNLLWGFAVLVVVILLR